MLANTIRVSAIKISNIMYLPFLSQLLFSTLHFILGFMRIIVPFLKSEATRSISSLMELDDSTSQG